MLQRIFYYFPNLNDEQRRQFVMLGELYAEWNNKINLISRNDIANLYEHHVLHSLAIAKVVHFLPGASILDVGTGGGFPGIPLAITYPDANFLLVDSIGKKVKAAHSIAGSIGLKNITTLHERAENVPGEYDFVVSRAVARLDEVWPWVKDKFKIQNSHQLNNGLIYLKGGDITAEVPPEVAIKRWDIANFYTEEYFKEKAVLLITKDGQNQTQ